MIQEQEADIIYNLLTYLNAAKEEDMYYSIALTTVQNLDIIPNCSINELADLCFTSTATISRFCKKFGCASFPKFKEEVREGLNQARNEIHFPAEELQFIQANPAYLIDKVYHLMFETLLLGKQSLQMDEVDALCQLIHDAKKVHFFGFQFNKIVASDFQLKMIKLGKFIYSFVDHGDDSQKTDILDEDSLAVFLSVSAREPHLSLINTIHQKHAKVALFTMNPDTVLKEHVDYFFSILGKESDFTVSSISGSIGFLTVLNIVYLRYGILHPKQ